MRGLARIFVLPIVSSARMNPVTLLATKPNLAPLVADVNPCGSNRRALGDRAAGGQQLRGGESDVAVEGGAGADRAQGLAQAVDQPQVDPQLAIVLVVDADDHRLDQHLDGADVDPLDDLVDDLKVGFIILDDQMVVVRQGVSPGRRLESPDGRAAAAGRRTARSARSSAASAGATAGRHRLPAAGDERRRLADPEFIRRRDRDPLLADVAAQERADHAQDLVGADIAELINLGEDPFPLDELLVVLEFFLGVDVMDLTLLLVLQVGQLDDRLEDRLDGDALEVRRDGTRDLGRDEDIHPAATAE